MNKIDISHAQFAPDYMILLGKVDVFIGQLEPSQLLNFALDYNLSDLVDEYIAQLEQF